MRRICFRARHNYVNKMSKIKGQGPPSFLPKKKSPESSCSRGWMFFYLHDQQVPLLAIAAVLRDVFVVLAGVRLNRPVAFEVALQRVS